MFFFLVKLAQPNNVLRLEWAWPIHVAYPKPKNKSPSSLQTRYLAPKENVIHIDIVAQLIVQRVRPN